MHRHFQRGWHGGLGLGSGTLLAAGMSAVLAAASVNEFRDPLTTPSATMHGALRPERETLIGIAQANGHAIAVGLRGLVVHSEDGSLWRQARVPLQADLVAVHMLDERRAWASGHDATILFSDDGGATWQKQFDRHDARQLFPSYYARRVAAGNAEMRRFQEQADLNTAGAVSLPFLGVLFDDANTGFAVGSFGMIMASKDGGRTWMPWLDRIDNDGFLNLNSIRKIHGQVYITGEQGMVYRLDRRQNRFMRFSTGYHGTFFDIVGNARCLIAFGLRGTAYRSIDQGASWQAIDTGTERTIAAGAVVDEGRRILLFPETGQVIQSRDDGASFEAVPRQPALQVYGASSMGSGAYLIVGRDGVQAHAAQ